MIDRNSLGGGGGDKKEKQWRSWKGKKRFEPLLLQQLSCLFDRSKLNLSRKKVKPSWPKICFVKTFER